MVITLQTNSSDSWIKAKKNEEEEEEEEEEKKRREEEEEKATFYTVIIKRNLVQICVSYFCFKTTQCARVSDKNCFIAHNFLPQYELRPLWPTKHRVYLDSTFSNRYASLSHCWLTEGQNASSLIHTAASSIVASNYTEQSL